jgi:cob(I)alamin adenosyltransferase
MFYTKKGDGGTTKLFDSGKNTRLSKSSQIFEVLGSLDELNAVLGYAKVLSRKYRFSLMMKNSRQTYEEILDFFSQSLFCIQAEVGGSVVNKMQVQISFLEEVADEAEKLLPPINAFVIPGGTEVGAFLDIARTVARRAERSLVVIHKNHERKVSDESLVFLNRLSSALYALARFANYQGGCLEKKPHYFIKNN